MKYTILFAALITLSACGGQAAKDGASDTFHTAAGITPTAVSPAMDTVSIGGVLYDITPVTRAVFDAVVSWTPDTSEQHNIDRVGGLVTRTADTLFFTTENGRVARLVNNKDEDGDAYADYDFMGEVPGTGQWLTFGGFYESYSYILISKATGDTTFLIGCPVVSPDRQYIICSNADMEAAFTPNGFGLYKNGKVPELIDESLVSNWGPEDVKWEDARHLLVKRQMLRSNSEGLEDGIQYIRLTARK